MAYEHQEKQLGMDRPIARRDFLNGAAIAGCHPAAISTGNLRRAEFKFSQVPVRGKPELSDLDEEQARVKRPARITRNATLPSDRRAWLCWRGHSKRAGRSRQR